MAMLGNLGENLTKTMKKLVGISVIDKKTIEEVVKEIQRALIQSDVNIALVLDLSKKIKKKIEVQKNNQNLKLSILCLTNSNAFKAKLSNVVSNSPLDISSSCAISSSHSSSLSCKNLPNSFPFSVMSIL